MKRQIITLFVLLVPSSAFANPPELCTEHVYLNTNGDPLTDSAGVTLSRFCQWTGPGAAIWDDDVCCAIDEYGAACSISKEGTCEAGLDLYRCKYGERVASGIVCYQSFPSTCSLGLCTTGVKPPDDSQEDAICCVWPNCYPWDDENVEECPGNFTWCDAGYSKVDGTVECFD